MRTSKRSPLVSTIIVVITIILCVQAANFVLSPYGLKSQVVWDEFRKQDNLDAVCLGSSLAARAYDPSIIDSLCGSTSFNMSTPSQYAAESFIGLREAIEHHQLKRVFYGVDYANFIGSEDLYPARTFENEKWKGDGFFERFADLSYMLEDADWLFDHRSLNWLFPWTESQPTGGVMGLFRNAKMRIDGTSLIEAAEVNEKGWHYYGQGYGNYTHTFDYNGNKQDNLNHAEQFDKRPINEKKLTNLADMADLCAANNIEFVAFVPALPEYSLISLKDHYTDISSRIRETVESHGGTFYDFNLAVPSFYQPLENHFDDFQHYNYAGGQAFSTALAKLLTAHDAGKDVDSWFTTYEQRIANIDHISTVSFTDRPIKGGLELLATCFAGTDVKVEYQFQAKRDKDADDSYETIRDWSEQATCDFKPKMPGRYVVRVNVRQVGSDDDFERRTQHVVRIKR